MPDFKPKLFLHTQFPALTEERRKVITAAGRRARANRRIEKQLRQKDAK